MERSIETSQSGHILNPKMSLVPKPRLAPKPFSLQKNTSIRSIHAPKTVTTTTVKSSTNQTGKSEAADVSKRTPTTHAQKPPQQTPASVSKLRSVSENTKNIPKTTKESTPSPRDEDALDSGVAPKKSDPASQTAPPKETPTSEPLQKGDVLQTNHNVSTDLVTNSEQKDEKKKEDEAQPSVVQKPEESGSGASSSTNTVNRWGGPRRSLSTKLTSRFQSGGAPLPPQPTITISTSDSQDDSNKPASSNLEQNQTTEPSSRESDEGGLKEDYSGGGSIKRRISLLFDSSQRPEVMTKKEEPDIINCTGGVKQRIKHWVAEKNSEDAKTEENPPVAPRPRSRSFEPLAAPIAEKIPETPSHEKPAATRTLSTQDVDPRPKVSSAEPPIQSPVETPKDISTEIKSMDSSSEKPGEDKQPTSTNGKVQLRSRSPSATQTANDEADSGQQPLKRDNVKRRSVRFGIVERDDGGPPLVLGSASESSSEEEEETPEDKAEEETPATLPVYRRVGSLQRKDQERLKQEEERLKHLELERQRAEENKQARLKLEEDHKREEEKEKEKLRQREEEKRREEEREREKLVEEEMERQRKEEWERERLREEEHERERLREEERERERQMDIMLQRQREEESEKAKQKEDRLKQDQEERERERLREERERQRLREEQKRPIHEHEEHKSQRELREKEINKRKHREEVWEKEWVKRTESLGEEEKEEMEGENKLLWLRQKEEDRETARQKEERLKQEEREKERLKKEAEERERETERELMLQRQKEEERERARQKEERLQQEEREKERLKKEAEEREREREKESMLQRQKEEERERERQKEEKLKQEEMEKEILKKEAEERERETERELMWQRQKEEDRERARQKEERLKQEEMERERLKKEAEERERERERELMWQRQKEEDRERARQKEERLKQEEGDKERLREEAEERRVQQDIEREMETTRQIEKQREEERREEERVLQMERERLVELDRKKQEEEMKREKELEEKLRMYKERESEGRKSAADLISFDSEDVPQYSKTPNVPLAETSVTPESPTKVVYDDFSVRKPLIEVDFDDFSVKPKRWGSRAKVEASPVIDSWTTRREEVEVLRPLSVSPLENYTPQHVAKPDSPEPPLAVERAEEKEEEVEERPAEEQLITFEVEEEEEKEVEEEEEMEEEMDEAEDEEEDHETQVNSYSVNKDHKDTDALIDSEPEQLSPSHDQTSETDGPKLIPALVPEVASPDVDSTDFSSFPESSAPLLDTSAQKSKANVGKRRLRSRPSRSIRAGPTPRDMLDWRACDTADGKEVSFQQRDSDSEEDQPKPKKALPPPPTSQRVSVFPGLSPTALIAQLKRRSVRGASGGRDVTVENKGREERGGQREAAAPSPSPAPRSSPRSASHLAGAALVLPPLGGTDGGTSSSPAWLKELKSKKRLSQLDSEA